MRPLPSPIDCELRQRCQWQRGRVWYIEVRGRAWYIEVCVLTFLAQQFIFCTLGLGLSWLYFIMAVILYPWLLKLLELLELVELVWSCWSLLGARCWRRRRGPTRTFSRAVCSDATDPQRMLRRCCTVAVLRLKRLECRNQTTTGGLNLHNGVNQTTSKYINNNCCGSYTL